MIRIGTAEAAHRIRLALDERQAFAFVRLGDGEMRALHAMRDGIMPGAWIEADHRGSRSPEEAAHWLNACREGLCKADMLGLPFAIGGETYLPPLVDELRMLIDLDAKPVCDTCFPAFAMIGQQLWPLLKDQRILIMNDQPAAIMDAVRMGGYSAQCLNYGIGTYPAWNIVGTVRTDSWPMLGDEQYETAEPAPSWHQPAHYVEQAAAYDFDIALVGFGWRCMIACPMLAEMTGKVVVDMGHILREVWLERPDWQASCSWGGFEELAPGAL
jgi:hypothetical protein